MQSLNVHNELRDRRPPLAFDADGFLLDPGTWNQQVARMIAEMDDIGPWARITGRSSTICGSTV